MRHREFHQLKAVDIDAPRNIGQRESAAGEPFVVLEPSIEFRQRASDPFGRPIDPFLRQPLIGDIFLRNVTSLRAAAAVQV